jgi:hypothetical protein
MITEDMFHRCDGFQCDKCKSHNTITIIAYTYQNSLFHEVWGYEMLCKDCNHTFIIKER